MIVKTVIDRVRERRQYGLAGTLSIIVGAGNNSKGGCRIRPNVERYLSSNGIAYSMVSAGEVRGATCCCRVSAFSYRLYFLTFRLFLFFLFFLSDIATALSFDHAPSQLPFFDARRRRARQHALHLLSSKRCCIVKRAIFLVQWHCIARCGILEFCLGVLVSFVFSHVLFIKHARSQPRSSDARFFPSFNAHGGTARRGARARN